MKHVWSLSKANLALNCPLQFHLSYVLKSKDKRTEQSGDARVGSASHEALEYGLKGHDTRQSLKTACIQHQLTSVDAHRARLMLPNIDAFIARFNAWRAKLNVSDDEVFIEHAVGMNRKFEPAPFKTWGANKNADTWFRGVWDLAALVHHNGQKILVITDHKTGHPKPLAMHYAQFRSYTTLALAVMPDVDRVRCQIHYVKTGDIAPEEYTRKTILEGHRPWLEDFIEKAEASVAAHRAKPEPREGWWCSFCPFAHRCELKRQG